MQLQILPGLDLFVIYCYFNFFPIKILGTLWGKYQALVRGGNDNILDKGISSRLFAFFLDLHQGQIKLNKFPNVLAKPLG